MRKILDWVRVVLAWCIAPHALAHEVDVMMEAYALGWLDDPSDRAEFIRYGKRITAAMVYAHAAVFGVVGAFILSALYARFF